MKAIVKSRSAPCSLVLEERAAPEPRAAHLVVRVRAAAICGTDLHIYHWNDWAAANYSPPMGLGHELCGEVVWAPLGEPEFRVGDLVAAETHIACGHCYQCLRGEGHLCGNLKLFSKSGYSTMAEMALVPVASARRVPPEIGVEVGAVLEPLGVAVHALELLRPAGSIVAVAGCGPIGLFAVAVARAMGAREVLAIDPVPYRRQLALRMGASLAIDPEAGSASQVMVERTAGRGVDLLVEASGHPKSLGEGLLGLRRGGVAALVGLPSKPVTLDIAGQVITRGITIHGVFGRQIDRTWQTMEGLLASGSLDITPAITHRFPLTEYQEAFETAASGLSGKVLLIP
jgi:threonine 3-dehydrogenase